MAGGFLFFCGCAAKGPAISPMKNLNINEYSGVSKAFPAKMPACGGLRGIRIHTSFMTDLSNYAFLETREMPNTRWPNTAIDAEEYYPYSNGSFATVYGGDLARDFTAVVNHILATRCGVLIVDTPEQADVSVSGTIRKFHSQIIDKVDDFNDGWNVFGGSVNMKIGTIVSVDSAINNTPWAYEELLSIKDHKWYKVDRSKNSALLGGLTIQEQGTDIKTYLHEDFLVSQYSQASALRRVEVVMLGSTSSNMKNIFQIYDDESGALIKSFKNIDHTLKTTSDYDHFNQYRKLYTTGFGNLLYLVNDFARKMTERISHEYR